MLWLFSTLLLALSGFGITSPVTLDMVNPSVTLLSPQSGDQWYNGGSFNVLWQAGDRYPLPEPISLWYSLNGGSSYQPIALGIANDSLETWLLPLQQSDNARVKIAMSDQFGNLTMRESGVFIICIAPPQSPEGLTLNISNGIDAVLSWLPVTQDMLGQPLSPQGYIVLFSENPNADQDDYYFLGETAGLGYTHHRVVLFRDNMYYRVLAWLDQDGRMTDRLNHLEALQSWIQPFSKDIYNSQLRWGGVK